MSMITSEVLKELMLLKKSDRDKFLSRIEEMAFDSMDILLNYKKFKEYPANI